jgi:putative transcriptional regulator
MTLELSGRLLLADPSLRDGFFNKSVILLGEHSPTDGAFGLVLNHPSGKTVGDVLPDAEFAPLARIPVHLGGPVSRDKLTFAAFWEKNSKLDFAVRISSEEAIAYLSQPGTMVRAFAGYSGWTENQLEHELRQESWSVAKPSSSLLRLSHDITLWKTLMYRLSPYHRILADVPDEILTN